MRKNPGSRLADHMLYKHARLQLRIGDLGASEPPHRSFDSAADA
jgi:hypothetical protein